MSQRPTFSEVHWPLDAESLEQAREWAHEMTEQVLDWTWRAFDQLYERQLAQFDFQQPLEQIERDLTSKHFICILDVWRRETEGYCALIPVHEFPELASRPMGSGKPPAYDLAFVWQENQRVVWPIEAKVIKTSSALREYLQDVDKFCSGKAAPFVEHGGLIAYLLAGSPSDFFMRLETKIGVPLTSPSSRGRRPYRISFHDRQVTPRICLHHLVLPVSRRTVRTKSGRRSSRKMAPAPDAGATK